MKYDICEWAAEILEINNVKHTHIYRTFKMTDSGQGPLFGAEQGAFSPAQRLWSQTPTAPVSAQPNKSSFNQHCCSFTICILKAFFFFFVRIF